MIEKKENAFFIVLIKHNLPAFHGLS